MPIQVLCASIDIGLINMSRTESLCLRNLQLCVYECPGRWGRGVGSGREETDGQHLRK